MKTLDESFDPCLQYQPGHGNVISLVLGSPTQREKRAIHP